MTMVPEVTCALPVRCVDRPDVVSAPGGLWGCCVRVMVTGDRGHVGREVAEDLLRRGVDVVGFDRIDGLDISDLAAVARRLHGCDAVVHVAALPHDTA